MARRKTNEEFIEQVNDQVGNEYEFLEPYINAKTKLRVVHCYCNHVYQVTPDDFVNSGNRCPNCQINKKKTHDDFVKQMYDKHGDEFIVVGKYRGGKSKVDILHKVCGKVSSREATGALRYKGCMYCGTLRRSGHNHYKYNPDMSNEERLSRENQRGLIMKWSKEVYERDDYICKKCGKRGNKLNAHHINSWDKHPDERFNIDNGITLCVDCHKEFHMNYGYGSNDRKQFDKFINK